VITISTGTAEGRGRERRKSRCDLLKIPKQSSDKHNRLSSSPSHPVSPPWHRCKTSGRLVELQPFLIHAQGTAD